MTYSKQLPKPAWLSAFLTGLASTLIVSFSVAPQTARAQTNTEAETPDAVVHVKGMACQMCARSMTNALEKLSAVEKADVKLKKQTALLTLNEDQTVTDEKLRSAVEGAGYEFRKVVFAAESTGASDDA